MRRSDLVRAVACLALFHAAAIAQESPQPARFSLVKTPAGARFTSKDRANRFSFEVAAKQVKPLDPDKPIWEVDGQVFQVVSVPPETFGAAGTAGTDETLLRMHQTWDFDHFAGKGRRKVEGSEEVFSSPEGRKCLYWELAWTPEGEKKRQGNVRKNLYASTIVNGNVVLTSYAVSVGSDDARGKRSLKDAILSLKSEGAEGGAPRPGGRKREGPISPLELLGLGTSKGLINSELMTPRDEGLAGKVVLKPRELVRWTRLLVLMRGFEAGFAEGFMDPQASVFDGKSGHVVNLTGFDRSKNCFLFSDPWRDDTFLAKRNNKAGANAVAHSAKVDDWEIKEEELERVLYRVDTREVNITRLSHFIATMRGDADKAVVAYLKIKSVAPESPLLDVARLNRAGSCFLDFGEDETAVTVFTVNLKLNPSSAEAHAGLAEALSRRGRKGPAAEHCRRALEKVAADPSLNEQEKAALARRAAETLRQLGTAKGR